MTIAASGRDLALGCAEENAARPRVRAR